MNLIDKILLVILILLLPIGILVSNAIITNDTKTIEDVSIDAEKLKMMVDKYSQIEANSNKPKKQFVVSSVEYASSSGILIVKGSAPSATMSIMMSATVLPNNEEKDAGVLGNSVENFSISVLKDGKFEINYPIKNDKSVVEMRLEQEEVVRTIRYDLDRKIQTL